VRGRQRSRPPTLLRVSQNAGSKMPARGHHHASLTVGPIGRLSFQAIPNQTRRCASGSAPFASLIQSPAAIWRMCNRRDLLNAQENCNTVSRINSCCRKSTEKWNSQSKDRRGLAGSCAKIVDTLNTFSCREDRTSEIQKHRDRTARKAQPRYPSQPHRLRIEDSGKTRAIGSTALKESFAPSPKSLWMQGQTAKKNCS